MNPEEEKPRSEEEVKQQTEELWENVTRSANEDITKMLIKQDNEEIFTLSIANRKTFQK